MRLRLFSLALSPKGRSVLGLLGVLACSPALSQTEHLQLEVLNERGFVQLLTERNLELQFGKQSVEVAENLAKGETGVYEPIVFGSVKRGATKRQRTAQETDHSVLQTSNFIDVLDQYSRQLELGVKGKNSLGGEVSLAAKRDQTKSNVLRDALGTNLEVNSALTLSYKQPLLRGRGSVAVETDIRVAELEWQATQWQYRQQLQKLVAEGLSSFWQIRTAEEVVMARHQLADISGKMLEDARARVQAGKLSQLALGQLEREIAVRQGDVLRAEQIRDELKLRMLSTLDLPSSELFNLRLDGTYGQDDPGAAVTLDQALARWAPFQIAKVRLDQGTTRLAYARNQSLPAADLVMSYGQSGLADTRGSWTTAKSSQFPDWYVGINIELGMWGQRRASAQMVAQQRRVSQSDIELQAIRIAFANDWFARQQAWQRAQSELTLMQVEYANRQHSAEAELQRLASGMGSHASTWIAQQDAIESKIRLLDAKGRAESARLSLLLAQGTLLNTYGVSFEISQGL